MKESEILRNSPAWAVEKRTLIKCRRMLCNHRYALTRALRSTLTYSTTSHRDSIRIQFWKTSFSSRLRIQVDSTTSQNVSKLGRKDLRRHGRHQGHREGDRRPAWRCRSKGLHHRKDKGHAGRLRCWNPGKGRNSDPGPGGSLQRQRGGGPVPADQEGAERKAGRAREQCLCRRSRNIV